MTIEMTILVAAAVVSIAGVLIAVLVLRASHATQEAGLSRQLSDIEGAVQSRDDEIRTSVNQLESQLGQLELQLASREAVLNQHVSGLDSRMTEISSLFSNDRARGGWGEISLRRTLELGGLVEGRDFTEQILEGDSKPDVIVHLPGDSRIVIDSKFPVARYLEAISEEDAAQRARLLVDQGSELARVGADLAKRKYDQLATGGYVVMYLPSQAVYEAACEANTSVVEKLMESRVLVAGPTSLFALVASAGALLTQHRALRDAEQILGDVRELNKRLGTWVGHLDKIGSSLVGAIKAYNGAVGSWSSRVQPQLGRVSNASGGNDPGEPGMIDEVVRPAPEGGLRAVG
jgi:DNA recombination protein RmuC